MDMRIVQSLALALPLVFVACSQADRGGGHLPEFLSSMREVGYDYEPAETPAALARQADAVVSGTIANVSPGQSYAPTPGGRAEITTSVLEVTVDAVLAGDTAVVTGGSVYVEIAHPAPFDHAAFAATVPRSYGVFFLDDRTTEPYWDTVLDEGAGRPPGARITAPFVQGFLIEDESGRLVSVMEPLAAMPPSWRGLESVDEVLSQL